MTETQDEKSILYLHFGTSSPYWRLAADSNAIELAAVKGATNIALALQPDQAQAIRALTGITASLRIDIVLYGDPIQLRLVGRKINPTEWAGTASAHTDTDSVARDLVEGLSFAETVVSEANSVIVIVDQHGRVQRFNKVSEEYTGKREQDIVGRSVFEMFMTREEAAASRRNIAEFYKRGQSYEVERLINTVKGPRPFLFRNKFVTSGSGEKRVYLICSGTDITEERQAQERLRVLANTDVLTNLPNRHAITTRLKAALAEGEGASGGVLFLDLDNFKRINDHYGHGFGDRLLKSVAVAISSCLSPGQTLARLGGDEFLVLQEGAEAWQLEATAARIIERLREPFRQELIEVYTSCSIGIAMYPEHGDDLDSVVRSADIAMYVAKEAGRHTYRVFQPEMDRRNADYVWLDTNLRKALAEGHLMLYYQPKLAGRGGEVDGVEALLRWRSPERGMICPSVFIPYAEESGLISQLGVWVMREAARQAAAWKREGLDLRVAVNMSARQLDDKGVVSEFMRAVNDAGLDPCLLDIELTESCLIEDEVAAIELMKQRGADVPIPVDVVCAKAFGADAEATVKAADEVAADDMILDIGPQTAQQLAAILKQAGTIVWNGPVGVFEFDQFANGTKVVAQAIADSEGFSIAGGGDTLAAIAKYGIGEQVGYISTGGGAFLEFLEGKTLPAVAVLQERAK